jgi:mRNA-degrading endonuclease toxin of MazEF toxin-antitoxin module
MVFWFDDGIYNKSNSFIIGDRSYHSYIEAGRRPYLVVSCDTINATSLVCTVAPITTSKERVLKPYPTHITFKHKNEFSTILLDQIRTVDTTALGNYLYTLSDDTVEEVNKGLTTLFGIKNSFDIMLNEMLERIEPVINDIIKTKSEQITNLLTVKKAEDMALLIGQNIEQIFNSNYKVKEPVKELEKIPEPEEEPIIEEVAETVEEDIPVIEQEYEEEKPVVEIGNIKIGNKRNWDIEMRKRYINDCDSYPMEKVADMWGISKKSVYSMKHICKKALKLVNA